MSAWLKRRAAVAAEARAEAEAHEASLRQAEAQALEARPDAELLAEAGLKEPEALVSAEEIRAFLKHALPDRLKRRALRRLWGLNPVLANVDGLVDYGEDFTDTAMCVENMQSLYTVGKGMLEWLGLRARELEILEAVFSDAGTASGSPGGKGAGGAAAAAVAVLSPAQEKLMSLAMASPSPSPPQAGTTPQKRPNRRARRRRAQPQTNGQ